MALFFYAKFVLNLVKYVEIRTNVRYTIHKIKYLDIKRGLVRSREEKSPTPSSSHEGDKIIIYCLFSSCKRGVSYVKRRCNYPNPE